MQEKISLSWNNVVGENKDKKRKVVISTETSPGNIMQSFILSYTPYYHMVRHLCLTDSTIECPKKEIENLKGQTVNLEVIQN